MSDSLTARQTQILKALIDEYIATADPVGSEVLEKKHNLGVSSATIRNEMVALTKLNYLKQPHTSAGRVPTPTAMKFYISQLMEEKQLSLTDEVKAKEEVWDVREDLDRLMEEALDDGRTWHAGLANVFINPEFSDMNACIGVFSMLEEQRRLMEIFFKRLMGASPIEVLFGEDLDWPELEPIGIVATHFKIKGHQGALGLIGPARVSYATVIPVLRYFGGLIQEVAQG
jgi:transcriptional regulator of heat shock response